MRVIMLNFIGCASLRYPGLDTPRFKEVSGDRLFLATEKVRIGENTVPDTRRTRCVSWNMTLPDLPVFSKNTGPHYANELLGLAFQNFCKLARTSRSIRNSVKKEAQKLVKSFLA